MKINRAALLYLICSIKSYQGFYLLKGIFLVCSFQSHRECECFKNIHPLWYYGPLLVLYLDPDFELFAMSVFQVNTTFFFFLT